MLASGLPAVLVVPFDRCSETLSGPNGCDGKEHSDAAGKAPSGLAREASPPVTSETLEAMNEARVAGEVLAVEASRDGLLLLCVSVRRVVILGCSAGLDWTPVGQCARPKLEKTSSYAKVAWGPDGHNVVVCSDSGYAEFYSLTHLEVPCLRLPAPSWETTGSKELQSSRQVEISFRTAVRNTVEGERIMLQSVAANRMWLLMGTGRGSIIRVLWTGEVVDDREVDLFPFGQGEDGERPARGAVIDVCIGWRQRVGFIADGGACGVYVQKNANSIYYLKTKGAKSIALHRMRPLALVGLENGDVEVYAVGSKGARKLRTIELPVQDLPSYLALRVKEGAAAATIKWAPDGSSHFAVGYVGLGFIIWSSSGCRTTTLFLPDHTEPKARAEPQISDNLFKLPAPAFALAAQGTALVCGAVLRTADCQPSDMVLNSLELVKTCLASGQLASGSTSMCLQGWNHVLILQNQEWDVDSLAWHRIDLPSMYINDNWPIQLVAANVSGSHIAVAGKHGVAVHSNVTKRWRLFGEISEETKIKAKLLFWWGDEVICIVTRDDYTRVWELLCFSSEDLSMHAILGRVALPGRPLAVDTLFVEGMTVLAFTDRISLYRMCFHSEEPTDPITEESPLARGAVDQTSNGDDAPEGPVPSSSYGIQKSSSQGSALSVASDASARPRTKELFVIRRPVSASSKSHKLLTLPMEGKVEFIDSIPLGFGEQDDEKMAPVNLSLLPCGTTRRGGCPIKIPKCVLLSSDGTLFLFDIDDGSRSVVSRDVLQIFPQSWSKIEQADDVVLHSLLQQKQESYAQYHQSSAGSNGVGGNGGGTKGKTESALSGRASKLPAVLLYTLWLMDHRGIRLWLPALDITGEFLNTRCAETYTDVHPIGILESHGLVVGLTQRARALTNLRLPCYELATRVTPTTHALLSWLIRAERQDLAAQVLVQARTHLPLFLETLDLFLFGAVETDYKNQHNQHFVPLLPLVVQVLRTGKVSHVVDPRTFDKLVITSARKMESSRWELFFASAGNPEQIFNNAVYYGDLKVAASSMIISDHFSPQTSAKRLARLSHSATLQGDSALLEQISTYQSAR